MFSTTLSPAELGYIAGLIDGEGWVGLPRRARSWKHHPERTHYRRPVIVIGMAKRACVDYVAGLFGINVEKIAVESDVFRLRIYPDALRWLLPQLIPHLRLKRRQAEILMEFMSVERPWTRGRDISDAEVGRREELAAEMKLLNERPAETRRKAAAA